MAITKVKSSVASASVGGRPLNLGAVACVQPILSVSGTQEQSQVFTLKQAAQYLQISKAHLSNVINGKVAGVPPLRHARAGRRILIKRQWADEWLEVAGQESLR
jgi:excisionase family DNA binding protein